MPCAVMLDLAETLNPLLDKRKQRLEQGEDVDEDVADVTLQLVFFDGEEAFQFWTDTDSIYGARLPFYHLASVFVAEFTLDTLLKNGAQHTFGQQGNDASQMYQKENSTLLST